MCFDQTPVRTEIEERYEQNLKRLWAMPRLRKVNGQWECHGMGYVGVCTMYPGWSAIKQGDQMMIAHHMWTRIVARYGYRTTYNP